MMKMNWKKTVGMLAGMAVLGAALTGCGNSAGGATGAISVVSREDGSGTRGAFVELCGVEDADGNDATVSSAEITNSTAVMMQTVEGNASAIGYMSMGSLGKNDKIKAVQINGVDATPANVSNGSYVVSRPFNIVTKSDGVSDAAQDFINYILSDEGQDIVEQEDFIKTDATGAYKSNGTTGKTISVAGSSSVTPVMQVLAEKYEAVSGNKVEVNQSDSSTGVSSAIDGTCDIGMASRELKDSETSQGVVSTVIAVDGIAVIVNSENTVTNLTLDQVGQIYKGELTEWSQVTAQPTIDATVFFQLSFRRNEDMKNVKENIMRFVFILAACVSIAAVALICIFLFANGIPAIAKIGPLKFLGGTTWNPNQEIFGIFPMIIGSIYATAIAMIVGVPIGLLTSVFLARFCPEKLYKILKPAVSLLAGIPSIVYGFFGLVVMVPIMQNLTGVSGKNVLTAGILLGFMILPTIIEVSEAQIRAVPNSYYESSLALGATHERSVYFAMLPAAKSGIMAGVILGIGRAIGETMAVVMIAGNQAVLPKSLVSGVRTMTANIVLEMGYATDLHREALIATGVVLFVFILIINVCFSLVKKGRD